MAFGTIFDSWLICDPKLVKQSPMGTFKKGNNPFQSKFKSNSFV